MIKSVLVCTDGSGYGDAACEYGIHLALRLKGRLSALHVLDSRMLEGPLMADISGWVGAQPFGAQLQQFRELMQEKGEAVIAAFNDRCVKAGIEAEGWVKMGHPISVILEEESRAELLVIGQKGEHAEFVGDMMGSTVERVVRNSIKPCLVTPEQFKPVSKILIAYDGSGHASRALQEGIELAQALALPASILTVAEDKDMDKAGQVSREGQKLAAAHEFEAAHLVAKGPANMAILDMAAEHGFDLIVMGAFGHGRIREMILGSTTTSLIAEAFCPVMLVR